MQTKIGTRNLVIPKQDFTGRLRLRDCLGLGSGRFVLRLCSPASLFNTIGLLVILLKAMSCKIKSYLYKVSRP